MTDTEAGAQVQSNYGSNYVEHTSGPASKKKAKELIVQIDV